MNCIIYVDGGSRGNPGPAAAGVFIQDQDTGQTVHQAGYFLGRLTNNVAEYTGLIRSLEAAIALEAACVIAYSDSELMVRQLTGRYKVKSADLKPLFDRARRLLEQIGRWSLEHVRRERNQEADRLANLAMDAKADVILVDRGKSVAAAPGTGAGSGGGGGAGTGAGDEERAGRRGSAGLGEASAIEIPCWSVTLKGKNGQCLAGAGKGSEYTFGPTTPDGCCVHAAAASLTEGPLTWSVGRRAGSTRCRGCGMTIEISRLA